MSDALTNLLTANRSSTVLQGIANPPQINPLGAMTGAAQTANAILGVRQKQAEQAAGQAFLNSIDPATGQPNQSLLMQNLRADPATAMAAQTAAQSGQNLDATTYQLHTARLSRGADALGTLIGQYPNGIPLEAAQGAISQELKSGLLTPQDAKALGGMFTADPRQNTLVATQLYSHNMNSQQQLDRMYGTRQAISTPQGTYVPTVPPPGQGGTMVIPHGAPPGQTTTAMVPMDDQGVIPQDANGVPQRTPKSWQQTTVPVTAVPGVPTGGPPTMIPANPTAPQGTPPGRFSPVPTNSALRNPAAATTPTAPTPGPIQQQPLAPPPQQPTPAQAPAQTPPAATSQQPVTGAQPPVFTQAPQGQPEQLAANIDARNKDVAAIGPQQTQVQNMKHAYDALSLITTGKSQESVNGMFNFLQGYGLLPQGATNRLENYDLFKKYTTKAIIDNGLVAGNTDLGRTLAAASNPSDVLSTAANREVLRNDIGKTLQGIAAAKAEKQPDDPSTAPGYLSRRATIASNTDPRGFAWSLYSPQEQQQILNSVKDNKGASDRLHRAIGMSDTLGLDIPFPTINRNAPATQP